MSTSMSFAQTYILASKVRTKLTREASNPKSSLRVLVTQANMLDNLMDHIATETAKRNKFHSVVNEQITEDQEEEEEEEDSSDDEIEVEVLSPRRISFSLPARGRQLATSVAEYEVESDSDSDSDDDSDYYYSSEEDEDEMESPVLHRSASTPSIFRELPSINLQFHEQEVEDEDEDDEVSDDEYDHHEVPGLCRSPSLTDDEDFEHEHYKIENQAYKAGEYQGSLEYIEKNSSYAPIVNRTVHHQRHNAIMSMEAIL